MKKALITLIAVLFSYLGIAQNGPKIGFKAIDNTLDFGTISKDKDNGIRAFEFTNIGNEPLIITSIQSTPSCIILSKQNDVILPNKSSKIKIKYNMALGPIRKTITIESNAINYEEGRIPLKITGEVKSE